jgi:hypothetical protein
MNPIQFNSDVRQRLLSPELYYYLPRGFGTDARDKFANNAFSGA